MFAFSMRRLSDVQMFVSVLLDFRDPPQEVRGWRNFVFFFANSIDLLWPHACKRGFLSCLSYHQAFERRTSLVLVTPVGVLSASMRMLSVSKRRQCVLHCDARMSCAESTTGITFHGPLCGCIQPAIMDSVTRAERAAYCRSMRSFSHVL